MGKSDVVQHLTTRALSPKIRRLRLPDSPNSLECRIEEKKVNLQTFFLMTNLPNTMHCGLY